MEVIATAPRTETPRMTLPAHVPTFILCARCGGLEVPGLTYLTPWGLLCTLCHDDYESARGAGEEGF